MKHKPEPTRHCIDCGCTDDRACVNADRHPCFWVSIHPPLCSACAARRANLPPHVAEHAYYSPEGNSFTSWLGSLTEEEFKRLTSRRLLAAVGTGPT